MSCTFFSLCRVHFALCRVLFNKKKFNNKKNYFERFGKFHSAHRQTAHVLKLKTEIPITYIYIYIYTHSLTLSFLTCVSEHEEAQILFIFDMSHCLRCFYIHISDIKYRSFWLSLTAPTIWIDQNPTQIQTGPFCW